MNPLREPHPQLASVLVAWLAAVVACGGIVVFGGEDLNEGSTIASSEWYGSARGSWHNIRAMPRPRHGLAAATLGRDVFAIGGGPAAGFSFSALVDRLRFPCP